MSDRLLRKNTNTRRRCLRIAAILALFTVSSGLISQETPGRRRIQIESALVTVPVIVSNAQGRFLPGLNEDSFTLYQDGAQVPISLFLTSEDPIKIALLLDTSVSTTAILNKIKQAARRFLLQLRPQDLAMVVSFDSNIQVLCPLSSDSRELNDAIKSAKASGVGTRMRDAINQIAGERFKTMSGRKAIVLLTDGDDHGSRISATGLLDTVASSSTLIYSVFYRVDLQKLLEKVVGSSSPKGPSEDWNENEEQAAQYIEKITELSAGRTYKSDIKELDAAFKQISEELRCQYLIGFYPEKSKLDGKVHTLAVSVSVPDAVVRNRRSYRAVPNN